MDKDRSGHEPNVIEGADAGALGTSDPPRSAPEAAEVDPTERRVPGADAEHDLPTEEKPWFTSLVADSDQAGVANDEPDEQPPPVYERPPRRPDTD